MASAEAPSKPNLEGGPEAEPSPLVAQGEAPELPSGGEAKATYDTGGDVNAAFDQFNEDYPDEGDSDESSDFDDEYDSDLPKDLYGDGTVTKQRTQQGQGWETPKDLCACVVEYSVSRGTGDDVEVLDAKESCELKIDECEAPYAFFDDVLNRATRAVLHLYFNLSVWRSNVSEKASTFRELEER